MFDFGRGDSERAQTKIAAIQVVIFTKKQNGHNIKID